MFTVLIGAPPDVFDHVHAYVQRIADAFGRAFALGFFEPVALEAPILVQPHLPSRLEIELRATRCPPGLLRVLWGMCEWGRQREGVLLEWLGVHYNGQPISIDSVSTPSFGPGRGPSFRLSRPQFVGFGDQLVVLVQFAQPPNDQQMELLQNGFETWKALLFGGLPPEGSRPGESEVGATTGFLIMPATYQWFVEGVAADSGCIDLLINFFERQASRLRVNAIDVEA